MIAVRTAADPDRPPPRLENLRHNLAANETLVYVIAHLGGEPAGCGFVDPWPDDLAIAHLVVVPALRRRGIGSALLAELGRRALEAGRPELEGEVVESDVESQEYLERRGYRVVGGEKAVALDLTALEPEPAQVPPGVEIVALADRPELAEALYAVGIEAAADIPGNPGDMSFRAVARDRARSADAAARPALRRGRGRGAGRVCLDGRPRPRRLQRLTAVRRAWRRRYRHRAEADADRRCEARRLRAAHHRQRGAEPAHADAERQARLPARAEPEHADDARPGGRTIAAWPSGGPARDRLGHRDRAGVHAGARLRPRHRAARRVSRSPAGRTRRCTAAGRGRSASTRASARPRRRTSASAISSSSARRASRSRSTCRRSSATTRTTRWRRARSAARASPSTRSRTCGSSSTASRSTRSRPR